MALTLPPVVARWRHLPREARDTLFLLAVIAWTLLPHATHLAPWCLALAGAILIARARMALRGSALPSRWTLLALLVLASALTWMDEGTLLGKEAGVTMLVVLMALKTLELRARRDAMVVFLLGFFVVLTHFLYSQSPWVAAAMLVSVWGLLTALVLAHLPVGQPSLWTAARIGARTALLGLPVMIALFVLFPRIAPLWGLPQDAGGRTGLSGSLSLGGVADLALDDSIALRLRFDGKPPPPADLYLRGPVLSAFDGRHWTRARDRGLAPTRAPRPIGQPLGYEMLLEPSRLELLPLPELTPATPGARPQVDGWAFVQRRTLDWVANRPLTDRLRLRGQAWMRFSHAADSAANAPLTDLDLPDGYNPRTLQWAADFARRPEHRGAGPMELVQALLAHIRTGAYTYTLEPGPYGRDAIDEFWLDRKLGFCEHYAAAFVVVLRAMGVPARIVTGYQGADPPREDGWMIVRQSNAHAWTEVWIANQGWVRVDPTAAVAPDRVQLGRSLAPPRGLMAATLDTVNPALAATLRGWWERADQAWAEWVLNYSRRQQFDLLGSLGIESPRWEHLAYALVGLLSLASLGAAAWALWDRQRQDPWQRLQQRVRERLAVLGVAVAPHEPPRTRAERVRAALGPQAEVLARTLERLDHQRYAGDSPPRPDPRWWRQFLAEAQRCERPAENAGR